MEARNGIIHVNTESGNSLGTDNFCHHTPGFLFSNIILVSNRMQQMNKITLSKIDMPVIEFLWYQLDIMLFQQ
jgi:hypothetical protein